MERKEAKNYINSVFGVAWKELTRVTGPRKDFTWDAVFESERPPSINIDGIQLELGPDMNGLDSITIDQTRNDFRFTFSRGVWEDGDPAEDIWVNETSIIRNMDNDALDAGFRKEIVEILRSIGSTKFK